MYVKINYTSRWSYEGVAEVKVGEISEYFKFGPVHH